ncbi:N-6 DNA methylase [Candidatus Parabeggiatoa sp. HSG14]|uniref:HsdM family class I SAM-dependent methyltransferase n=1 Tax=Candidatus Parabeggiatoa sp. HSG14 TaxID=3055593 RepID=UPI0025A7AEFD|nr:N-6 DNA methylase [Thiotrichales bacterium HSG14]
MNTITYIAKKLLTPTKHLHQKGISIHAYLTDLTWLLFLKIAPMIDKADCIPTHLTWDNLIHKEGIKQYEYYQKVIKELEQVADPHIAGIYTYADTSFKNPDQLAQAITTLDVIDTVGIDDLGEVYETLLETSAYEDENRLLIVPRALVNLMIILTQPQTGELIQDPLAGTASFVVATHQYIQMMDEELSEVTKKDGIKKQDFIAIEPDLVRQRLALMNCLLHHINHPKHEPVRWGDSLLSNKQKWPLADVILSMLVFANDSEDELGKHDASLALLQHIYQVLKPGGRAAVILPDNMLKAAGPFQQVRRTLLDTCILHTVLRLPHGIFYPHKMSAHLLFFRKGETEKTEKVWFYDLRTHLKIFGQHLHLTREHLLPFEIAYGENPLGQSPRNDEGEKGRWRCFNRATLTKQGDRLDQYWLQDKKTALNDNNIVTGIEEVLNETVQELEALTDILCVKK